MSDSDLLAQLSRALSLAKQATNGWACYAKNGQEHEDIARLHREIAETEAAVRALLDRDKA